MTVRELVAALTSQSQDAEVQIQGTSVSVEPRAVGVLGELREDKELDILGDLVTKEDVWAFESFSDDTVIILTQ